MEATKEFNILSPDGINISQENFYIPEQAEEYFFQWQKRFEIQGYYSSNKGRISLKDLRSTCKKIQYLHL